jgi:hypothetical protein
MKFLMWFLMWFSLELGEEGSRALDLVVAVLGARGRRAEDLSAPGTEHVHTG